MSSFWPSASRFGISSQQSASSAAVPNADADGAAAAASSAAAQHIFSQSSLASSLFGGAYSQSQSQPQSQLSQLSQESTFGEDSQQLHQETCLTCGSTTFITDDATGLTICATCHTQSQTLSQLELVGEEDVEALAARTGGRMVSRRVGPRMALVPDSEIDNSVPLPKLEDCLMGYQSVLRKAAERAATLVQLDDMGRKVLLDTVGNIWFGYLKSWKEGAEYYATQHPELRFSLRDAFIGKGRREMVLRHLSARCCAEIRAEDAKNSKKKSRGRKRQRGGGREQSKQPTFSSIAGMLNHLPPNTDIDNKIAALHIAPSLSLIGSIVHLALTVLRAGVPSNHIVAWAASGSFPYLTNAYNQLSEELKGTLRPIKTFFVCDLPPAGLLDYQLDLLALACGMNLHRPKPGGVPMTTKGGSNKQITRRGKVEERATKYIDNVPLLAARLVSDLGFDQRVLDLTLSLIGVTDPPPAPASVPPDGDAEDTKDDEDTTEVPWTPLPLNAASVERLMSPLHVMAVIVVAVRMCEGWEECVYHIQGPHQPQESRRKEASAPVEGKGGPQPRLIPSSEAQLHMLGNGQSLERYMDVLEEIHFDKHSRLDPFGPFVSSLQHMASKQATSTKSKDDHRTASSVVRPNTAVAGMPNPNSHGSAEGKEANGIGKYVIYKSSLVFRRKRGEEILEMRPFHPHYTLLIEYVAYRADVEPSDLHNLVSVLDHEIFERSCFDLPEVRSDKEAARKKKTARTAAVKTAEEQDESMQIYHAGGHQQLALQYNAGITSIQQKPKLKRRNKRCIVESCTKASQGPRFNHMCQRHHSEKFLGKEKEGTADYLPGGRI